jgi:F-type H+-transporting ATPase subunit a
MGPIQQFDIIPYFSLGKLVFTNSSLSMLMTCVLTSYVFYILPRASKKFQILHEIYCNFITDLCASTIKHHYEKLVPFVSSIFLFILFGNLLGLIPGFFTFTSHMTSNLIISSVVVCMVLGLAIVKNGIKFVQLFAPSGVPAWVLPLIIPIELISFFMRILSLAIRLCINMCVGHITLKILLILATKFGPAGPMIGLIYIPFFLLEVGIAFLQAYIFTILTCVYLKDGVNLDH